MSNYKIFDGKKWVDPCWNEIYIRDNMKAPNGKDLANTWEKIDPHTREIYYHDGTYGGVPSNDGKYPTWKPITCFCYCNEAEGFYYDSSVQKCVKTEYAIAACEGYCDAEEIHKITSDPLLGTKGLIIWDTELFNNSMRTSGGGIVLDINNLEANTIPYALSPNQALMNYAGFKAIKNKVWGGIPTYAGFNRINSVGIWPVGRTQDVMFKTTLHCTTAKTFMIGMASRYGCNLSYYDPNTQTSTIMFEIPGTNHGQYDYWHTFPITLPVGNHELWFIGYSGSGSPNPVFGAEVYDISINKFKELFGHVDVGSLITKDDILGLNNFIVWSTKNFIATPFLRYPSNHYLEPQPASYDCAEGYTLTTDNGFPVCIKKTSQDCADILISDEPSSNEVLFQIQADYIILTYKFLKNNADTWPDGNGGDIYTTPYSDDGGITTKLVKNDIQGLDLDTHTRFYAGPNENSPLIDSHYYGYSGRYSAAPGPSGGGVFPKYKRDGVTALTGYSTTASISLDQESILLHSGDNQGTGAESVLINVKEIRARLGVGGVNVGTSDITKQIETFIESFSIEMRAWWHSSKKAATRYPVGMTAKFYTNDVVSPITAVNLSSYTFSVVGGIETILTTPPVIVADNINTNYPADPTHGSTLINDLYHNGDGEESAIPKRSKRINVLEYNFVTGVGKFVNNNTTLDTATGATGSSSTQKPSAI